MAKPIVQPIFWFLTGSLDHVKRFHTHSSYELFFCTSGRGTQHTPVGDTSTVPGELFFFPPGQEHCATRSALEGCDFYVINFCDAWLGAAVEGDRDARALLDFLTTQAFKGGNQIRLPAGDGPRIASCFNRLETVQAARTTGYRLELKLGLLEIFAIILRQPLVCEGLKSALPAPSVRERLGDVKRLVELYCHQPFTVEDAAAMACLSRSHFHALFKEEAGVTFKEYLNRVRIARAQQQLVATSQGIAETAIQCGFPSLSHFYHTFRRITGTTPRKIREAATGG